VANVYLRVLSSDTEIRLVSLDQCVMNDEGSKDFVCFELENDE